MNFKWLVLREPVKICFALKCLNMSVNPLIFRAYDIRGIAIATEKFPNVDLTPESVKLIGKGTGTYLQKISGKNRLYIIDKEQSTNKIHTKKK